MGRISSCLVAVLLLNACKDEPPKREPPPPEPTAASCSKERKVNDPSNVESFPNGFESFCLDPAGSDRGYGEGAKNALEDICELFDGECEIYKRFGVKRVIEAHYVDGKGSGATVDVYLSKYDSSENAYGMFTKRVVGDGDPAHPDTARPTPSTGVAALGQGNAYVWRGPFLAELTYNDSKASAAQMKERGDALLPVLVKAFSEKLTGETKPPAAVAALPEDKLLPLGIRYVSKEALEVPGTPGGAFGYYRMDQRRWRVLSMVVGDEDQAEDVIKIFAKQPGAAVEKEVNGVRFMHQPPDVPQSEWILGRKGSRILGVGDEPRALREGMSAEEHRSKTMPQDEKRKLLRELLSR